MILESIVIVIYSIALLLIFAYALAQLNLLLNYLRARSKKDKDDAPKYDLSNSDEVPRVTIQLPVYNEMYVMERLLDNIAKIKYPKDKLEIQVNYRNRIGVSKVSGTIKGAIFAGIKILSWIFKYSFK